jgi:hypothetical protein
MDYVLLSKKAAQCKSKPVDSPIGLMCLQHDCVWTTAVELCHVVGTSPY